MFITTYITWLIVSAIVMFKSLPILVKGKFFWIGQLMIFLQIIFFSLLIYFISGFFNLKLIGVLILGSELGVILNAIIIGFIGSLNTQWAAHGMWAGGEFGMKNKAIMRIIQILCLAVVIMYPIKVYKIPDDKLILHAVQYTTILFVSGNFILIPVLVGALRSENLDEDTRRRFLTAQLSNLIPTGLFLSLLFWSFGFSGSGIDVSKTVGISLFISPLLLIILFTFFFLSIILPYLVGAIRAKKWNIILLDKQNNFFEKTVNILNFPTAEQFDVELNELWNEIRNEQVDFIKQDEMVYEGCQIDQNLISPKVMAIVPAYRLSRNMDPRFRYLDDLAEFSEKLKQVIADLKETAIEKEQLKKARIWKDALTKSKFNLQKEREQARKAKLPILMTVGNTLIMLVISALLSEFGKWIFTEMTKGKK